MTKKVSLKVTPDASLRVNSARVLSLRPMLQEKPKMVLGNARAPAQLSSPVVPDKQSCFGPRGACLSMNGLIICDTGHHRLLGWNALPERDMQEADWQFGQTAFGMEGRNAQGAASANSLNVPTGICIIYDEEKERRECGLAVADAWNHRILIWHKIPTSNVQPDLVLGQDDFSQNLANRGLDHPESNTLHWPYGVYSINGKLIVADTGNRRVLIWNKLPVSNGDRADCVLGQFDFKGRDENAGAEPTAMSLRWPHGIAFWNNHLCISDAGNNRVLLWKGIPQSSGAPADLILGQSNTTLVDHNQSLYWPRDNTLNMPYGLTSSGDWLMVADTANSRIVGFHSSDFPDSHACSLIGQPDFHEKGDNRWQAAAEDSFCWPYGLSANNTFLTVADSGNNRVSLWEIQP